MTRPYPARISEDMRRLIRYIQANCLIHGKRAPSVSEITSKIAKKTNREEILHDYLIRFK